jgi:hypothetical protein
LLGKNVKGFFNLNLIPFQNIQSIWNNDHQEDNGIEKNRSVVLATSQLLFPGIYLQNIGGLKESDIKISFGFYVLLKWFSIVRILVNHCLKPSMDSWILVYLFFRNCFIFNVNFCLWFIFKTTFVQRSIFVAFFLIIWDSIPLRMPYFILLTAT